MTVNHPVSVLVPFREMKSVFNAVLKKHGFSEDRAERCAEIFAINTLEGVSSHGINRFPRFISNIEEGYINPGAVPSLIHTSGSLEQWNGNLGPGPLNAIEMTERAISIASESGIGMAGLSNTNHWMRGGYYGWQAARKGFIFIAWTNTIANMPAWGAVDARLGNNPFVVAVPYGNDAIVLDFAMSQFSYGKMETYAAEGRKLPFPGGYDSAGKLTGDPAEVLKTMRALPAGFWKGSGFSLLLDILATVLSGGKPTYEISKNKAEYGVSQVFIAIDPGKLKNHPSMEAAITGIINDVTGSVPEDEDAGIRYPGQNILKLRKKNLKNGIPVSEKLWDSIQKLQDR